MLKKIIVLSSDTLHHRYFINFLIKNNVLIESYFFETEHVTPSFPVGPFFEEDEYCFENEHFFKEIDKRLPQKGIVNTKSINSQDCVDKIKKINPDLGVVFGTGKLNKNVIELFNDGLINVHRGIAQKYRGLDSDLWAIYHNDFKNIGVTIHQVAPKLDVGNIVYQKKLDIKMDMKIHQLRYYTTLIASDLVLKTLVDYKNEKFQSTKQENIGRYYSFMPLDLKLIIEKKFNKYCRSLNE